MKKNPRKAFAVQAPNLEDASVFDCVADCMVGVCFAVACRCVHVNIQLSRHVLVSHWEDDDG